MNSRDTCDAVATAQIIGDRDNQEDSLATYAIEPNTGEHSGELLLILADGMGGHAGGEVASRLVVESFAEAYVNSQAIIPDALRSCLDSANEQLARTVAESPGLRGMATTLIGCVVSDNLLYWISVGDSPIWVLRNGFIKRINADHSMVPVLEEMVRDGTLDREDALVDFRRNLLRSGVAGKAIELVDLCEAPCPLEEDDLVILASDGVEAITNDELVAVLAHPVGTSLPMLARDLMTRIEAAGHTGQDTASVILNRH